MAEVMIAGDTSGLRGPAVMSRVAASRNMLDIWLPVVSYDHNTPGL